METFCHALYGLNAQKKDFVSCHILSHLIRSNKKGVLWSIMPSKSHSRIKSAEMHQTSPTQCNITSFTLRHTYPWDPNGPPSIHLQHTNPLGPALCRSRGAYILDPLCLIIKAQTPLRRRFTPES